MRILKHTDPGFAEALACLNRESAPAAIAARPKLRTMVRGVAFAGFLLWGGLTLAQESAPGAAGPIDESSRETPRPVLDDEPEPEMERPTIRGEPTEVQIGVHVIDVDEVNSADQSFAASVFIEARWNNPSQRHNGPGTLNRATTEVWTSRVSYITRMDRFILLSTVVVFVGLLHTALLKSGKKALVARLDKWSRLVYPVVLVLILIYSLAR